MWIQKDIKFDWLDLKQDILKKLIYYSRRKISLLIL